MARENASEEELEKLVCEIEEGSGTVEKKAFSLSRLKVPLMLAFLIAFFNQLSGINVILYFAPRLLGLAGIDNPLMASISLGIVNLAFTFVGLWLIDRLGRKQLLLIGSFGYIISLGICAWAFLSMPAFKVVSSAIDLEGAAAKVEKLATANRTVSKEEKAQAQNQFKEAKVKLASVTAIDGYEGEVASEVDALSTEQAKELASSTKEEASKILGGKSTLVLLCLLGFIAAHAVGQGAVIWVFIAEIFPTVSRGLGQSFGCGTHWVLAALLTQFFPIAIGKFDAGYIFAFFAFMMVLQLVWVLVMVPETKGVRLEDLEKRLTGKEA